MNTPQVLRLPMRGLVIVVLALLAASGLAVLTPLAWLLVSAPPSASPVQADPLEVVDAFHSAINSNNVDAVLALFADDATVTDNGVVIEGTENIRIWALSSERMAGLRLKILNAERHGEKVIWLDAAHDGSEVEHDIYLLRWEAIILEGKIQSLAAMPRYRPDLK